LVGLAAVVIGLVDASLIANSALGAAGAFQYIPPRLWFVAPLCWVAAALVLALPSYAVSRRRGAALTVIAMIGLFLHGRFHAQSRARIAAAVAAMVVGAAVVWLAGRRWVASPKRIAAAFVAAASAALVAGAAGVSRAERSPQPSRGAERAGPDVVVVFLDTVSYDAIFTRGTNVDPRLGFLMRLASRSVVFDRAYTPSPWTLPAHFSAVTGVPAHRLGIGFDHQQYDGRSTTLAERFRRRGYRTAAVISNTFLNRGTGFARGFETFEHAENALDVCRTVPGVLLDRWCPWFAASVCNWNAADVTRRAIAHAARNDDRPLFLLLNYMDAHDPYYVEHGCDRPRDANPLPRDVAPREYRRRFYTSHLAAIRCIDHHLSDLEAQLDRRKRGAVIAVLADHGEQFGEHGLVRHGNSLYDRLLHVPFMITGPGLAPHHVPEPVSIEALPRVVMEVADRGRAGVTGGAVVSWLMPPGALSGGEQWSLVSGRWHLISRGDGLALHDLIADPAEERSIVTSPAATSLLQALSQELARERRSRIDARSEDFRSLGYIR
jgi:arylsulfatase A-like enzyme